MLVVFGTSAPLVAVSTVSHPPRVTFHSKEPAGRLTVAVHVAAEVFVIATASGAHGPSASGLPAR